MNLCFFIFNLLIYTITFRIKKIFPNRLVLTTCWSWAGHLPSCGDGGG